MKGVYPYQGKFVVRINTGSRILHVGLFQSVDEASLNFDSASWYIRYPVSKRMPKFNNPCFSVHFPPPRTPAVARVEERLLAEQRTQANEHAVVAFILQDTSEAGTLGATLASLRALLQQSQVLLASARQQNALALKAAEIVYRSLAPDEPLRPVFAKLAGCSEATPEPAAPTPTPEAVRTIEEPAPAGFRWRNQLQDGQCIRVLCAVEQPAASTAAAVES